MSVNPEVLRSLWGKWKRGSETEAAGHHPLLYHLVDSAAAAREIFRNALSRPLQLEIASGIGLSTEEAQFWIPFLCALHDIGKVSPDFQARNRALKGQLQEHGLRFPPRIDSNAQPHGRITATVVPQILGSPQEEIFPAVQSQPTRSRLAKVLGGHHGVFPSSSEIQRCDENMCRDGNERKPWDDLRRQIVAILANHLLKGVGRAPSIENGKGASLMLLAGLISVADWIASNEVWFPFCTEAMDIDEYWEHARRRALHAIEEIHWIPPDVGFGPVGFGDLFPALSRSQRPLQHAITNILGKVPEVRLIILEAPMGEGKTEAALHLAENWRRCLAQQGCYFALPTMATSNQMFARVGEFLDRLFKSGCSVEFHLIHSHALLCEEYQNLKMTHVNQDSQDQHNAGEKEAVFASEWFMGRKRGLLAPFAVGTVDQALLSVLQTRHGFVRLFGLAHKTLVFDEVHAYDAYMLTLFQRLMQWLGQIGTTVVILSATLPNQTRREILRAFSGHDDLNIPSEPYPRITYLRDDGSVGVRHVPTCPLNRYTITLEWQDDDPSAIAQWLNEALAQGGCVAWVCNTVARAQQVYTKLETELTKDTQLILFHARYPFVERDRREKQCLRQFSKNGDRPHKAVLVATQVIEQSLDLDFDLMITELAPVDLVLQRAGRLHRHDRARPNTLQERRLILLKPEGHDEGNPQFGTSSFVYAEYILLQTWLALRDKKRIRSPDDFEPLIEQVYGDAVPAVSNSLRERLEKAKRECETEKRKRGFRASNICILPPDDENLLEQWNPELDEENPDSHHQLQARTRLSEPTVHIVCLHRKDNELFLDPEGTKLCQIDHEPSFSEIREFLNVSLALSYRQSLQDFRESMIPQPWRHVPLLRYHRVVVFENGTYASGNMALRLDSELGLVLE